jgi:photosystem II Psb27 protein
MKRYLSRLLSLVLVVMMGLVGCSSGGTLTGNYRQDTLALVETLRTAIALPQDAPNRSAAQAEARNLMNDFASRYRREDSLTKLSSYTTMRTAVNGLAGYYSSYPNRPLPEKLKNRLEQEFAQVEASLKRGA